MACISYEDLKNLPHHGNVELDWSASASGWIGPVVRFKGPYYGGHCPCG